MSNGDGGPAAGSRDGIATVPNVLEGKRIVVTGAGRGIGAAVAATARSHGADVFTVDVDPDTAVDRHVDVADEVAVAGLFDTATARMGGIDGLVNNVGIPGLTAAPTPHPSGQ